jgi:hypothetical protein
MQFRIFSLPGCYLKILFLMGMKSSLSRQERPLMKGVFEKSVLRRIFEPKRNEMTEDFRKLHNEELHNLYSSTNIIIKIKSRKTRWAVHVSHG